MLETILLILVLFAAIGIGYVVMNHLDQAIGDGIATPPSPESTKTPEDLL